MKKSEKCSRTSIVIEWTSEETAKIINEMSVTSCRTFTDYARRKILGKPIEVFYRNVSYDAFTEAYIACKQDLDKLLLRENLSEMDRHWLQEKITIMTETVVKLYDHVRQYRKKNQSAKHVEL